MSLKINHLSNATRLTDKTMPQLIDSCSAALSKRTCVCSKVGLAGSLPVGLQNYTKYANPTLSHRRISQGGNRPPWRHLTALLQVLWDILQVKSTVCIDRYIFYWILFKWIYQWYGIWKSLFILYNSLSWTLVRDSWFFLPVCLQANLWVCRYVT